MDSSKRRVASTRPEHDGVPSNESNTRNTRGGTGCKKKDTSLSNVMLQSVIQPVNQISTKIEQKVNPFLELIGQNRRPGKKNFLHQKDRERREGASGKRKRRIFSVAIPQRMIFWVVVIFVLVPFVTFFYILVGELAYRTEVAHKIKKKPVVDVLVSMDVEDILNATKIALSDTMALMTTSSSSDEWKNDTLETENVISFTNLRNTTHNLSDGLIEAIDLILEESEIIETIENANSSNISSLETSAIMNPSDNIDTKNIESSILSENMEHNVVEGSLHESDPMSLSLLDEGDEKVYSRNEMDEANPIYDENEEPQIEQVGISLENEDLENEALEENTGMITMEIGTTAMAFSEAVVETSATPKDNTHFLRKRKM